MAIIELDQALETPLTVYKRGGFTVRYAYARSKDAVEAKIRGEDYLVFRIDPQRLGFAVCDGVGSSFFGGLAAQIVGESLLEWLWLPSTCTLLAQENDRDLVKAELNKFLDSIVDHAKKIIDDKDISKLRNEFLRSSYARKREIAGSQSNFVCGVIDAPSEDLPHGRIWLFWLGDAKLKVWHEKNEITDNLEDHFEPEQSWSSVDGIRGEIHAYLTDNRQIDCVIAQTDGLDSFKGPIFPSTTEAELNQGISYLQSTPISDDISFLQITIPTSSEIISMQDNAYLKIDIAPEPFNTKDELVDQLRKYLEPIPGINQPKGETILTNDGKPDKEEQPGSEKDSKKNIIKFLWVIGVIEIMAFLILGFSYLVSKVNIYSSYNSLNFTETAIMNEQQKNVLNPSTSTPILQPTIESTPTLIAPLSQPTDGLNLATNTPYVQPTLESPSQTFEPTISPTHKVKLKK
jgi:serine/threonine protein phosphatase PrpC